MTYKHIKFTDSEIMKSYEQVAKKSGLMIPVQETVTKTASSVNIKSANYLTEKILLLCSELKEQGFVTKADELEFNFLNYKAAAAKDPGEQRIQEAHPDKVQFGDSELGIIETIIQQHEKILNVVNKKPTGKLASKHIINAVKDILIGNKVKLAFEVTEDVRKQSSVDTLKQSPIYLNNAITDLRSITEATEDDENKINVIISNIKSLIIQIKNIEEDIVSVEYLSMIVGHHTKLKSAILSLRDSNDPKLNSLIPYWLQEGKSNSYKDEVNKALNNITMSNNCILKSIEVLNGSHDDFIKQYKEEHENKNAKNIEQIFKLKINKFNDLKNKIKSSSNIDETRKETLVNFVEKELIPYVFNSMNKYVGTDDLKNKLTEEDVYKAELEINNILAHKSVKAIEQWAAKS